MRIVPTETGCGAEIVGIDLNAMSDAEVEAVADAQAAYGVVFLRDQTLSPDEQLAAAKRFGPINVNRFFTPVPEQPQVAMVLKEPKHEVNVGGVWHTDHSYDDAPALGSMLYALEVPAKGGDTLFASMYKAFDALSPGLQRTLEGLNAVHSSRHVFGAEGAYAQRGDERFFNQDQATQDAVHPMVIRHPRSSRAALYVNPAFTIRIDGWTVEESQPLLTYLYDVAQSEAHTCRFRWEVGSVAFWDNRATWHHALNDYPGERRLMHRVTVDGEPLDGYRSNG
ncbi:MAG: TauD/TfdA family dioxygenase [Gammaproteobacteria bacterium]|nr:TauD/TfdA family dioxygenase [Gammaproteobacteria bacterium]MYJ75985.1 TauD/TfdA family dioxygenase [Gammaproteobacteria bacterium]